MLSYKEGWRTKNSDLSDKIQGPRKEWEQLNRDSFDTTPNVN